MSHHLVLLLLTIPLLLILTNIPYSLCGPPHPTFTVTSAPKRVHLDIEPHALGDQWQNHQNETANKYLDVLERVMELLRPAGLPVAADVPFWYDTVLIQRNGITKSLLEFVLGIVDRIMIMDYRNYAEGEDSIISHATEEINKANQVGKEVIIGVETACVEPTKITFCDKTALYQEGEMVKVNEHFKNQQSYKGMAVHDLKNWKESVREHSQPMDTFPRDVFAWQTDDMIYKNAEYHQAYFNFLKERNIRGVYVGCIAIMLNEQESMASFLNETTPYGWSIELLYGKHSWVNDAEELYLLANRTTAFMQGLTVLPADDGGTDSAASTFDERAIVLIVTLMASLMSMLV
mmetsp:Transcript_3954/g.14956  ORF Transcript_3954/g.14956 Transcript_3954/m.14956 type:complete len:348 (-) Transcript_3954:5015-6058(-)|eukprot:CAMPEP_0117445558 /NCGR_PEP_ID=MMETSP0759-20121206/5860_1 /TAXON_ID=63605 /ORGANISM="Percolomonas cosmopolitus, Strain WS" /LENGTH=347 /DNA_ID=CAMNT_0005237743 /DNA_START=6 /DNA_END=1049 /DNA_ORIENTATION=-